MIQFRPAVRWHVLLAAFSMMGACDRPQTDEVSPLGPRARADYVGAQFCVSCHQQEVQDWKGSHHDLAMQVATEETVLGNFDGAVFSYAGLESTFSQTDGKHFVRTEGPDGELQEFQIAYTFGVEPLQQYLIELPGGRLQALSICWDSRAEEEGGQRWFHLYPDEAIDYRDPLHWTGIYQNWNFMCAECHSTNLRKGYRSAEDRYETEWSDIDVSCEACHGPGSQHVEWAELRAEEPSAKGLGDVRLTVQLGDRDDGVWTMDSNSGIAHREPPRTAQVELETCARCHSRRSVIHEGYRHGRALANTHRPALLEPNLYYADGQILDEVYVYGSFLQSRMHAAGVTCSDCHDPHSLKIEYGVGDAVCSRCHLAEKFASPEHHHHPIDSAGSSCLDCHMPARDYMVVDPRRDHSFPVPRPDLSLEIGVPNACNGCHEDRTDEWAAERAAEWYGTGRREAPHFGQALHAGREGQLGAAEELASLIADRGQPSIARASAVELLGSHLTRPTLAILESASRDEDSLVRASVARAAARLDPQLRSELLAPLLRDPIRLVRIHAARSLASVAVEHLDPSLALDLATGLSEYRESQEINADRPQAQLNLGLLYTDTGDPGQAELAYLRALEHSPSFLPAYVNLAEHYRTEGRELEAEEILDRGLRQVPDSPELLHALGLLRVRQQRLAEALDLLQRAFELRPEDPRMGYVFGVALNSAGQPARALEVLRQASESSPIDPELLWSLATIHRDQGDLKEALQWAERLVQVVPGDPGPKQLLAALRVHFPSGGGEQ